MEKVVHPNVERFRGSSGDGGTELDVSFFSQGRTFHRDVFGALKVSRKAVHFQGNAPASCYEARKDYTNNSK